ncbi:Putative pre-16S rRNA nuclease OS=Ureibacillus acetophenoni OX=614649 GN=SAMN05877842_102291 PE=3 SV=1 [Ureibacillus acetophenoni]
MRIMGLDVGSRTVGIAISDALGWTAQGIETVQINEDEGEFGIERIKELVKEYAVTEFVVGFPKNMNNTVGPRGEASQNYKKLLEETFQLPVKLWDERLSTMAAERMLIEADVSRKKRKKVIDKMAAVMILQGYLDSKGGI